MKNNINYLKATLLLTGLLFLGCETGVDVNKPATNTESQNQEAPVLSGIIDKPHNQVITSQSGQKLSIKKLYSSSAQPGYYLQVGFFERYKPNTTFERQLQNSNLKYTILNKNGDYYALIGAYKSYNQAHSEISTVKARLHKNSFVVHVLRP
jgi:hypothetical protein